MKRLFFVVVLMIMGYGAMAQIDFGPRVNLTSTNLSLSENLTNIQEEDAEFGYQLGAFLSPNSSDWHLHPTRSFVV